MKKIFCLLLFLPLIFGFSSCGNDDEVPIVSLQAKVSDAVIAENVIYVVRGETLKVDGIYLINDTGKEAALGVVTYFLDGAVLGQSAVQPFGFEMSTDNLQLGIHQLTAEMPIYVVDYPICWGAFSFDINVVESADDLPVGPTTSTLTGVVRQK